MATTRILRGKVYDKTTRNSYAQATVRLIPMTGVPAESCFIETDRNGEFQLDLADEKSFPEGNYRLSAFHEDAIMEADDETIAIPLEQGKNYRSIPMLGRDQFSQTTGIIFGALLVVGLITVSIFYANLHFKYPVPLDSEMKALISLVSYQVDSVYQAGDTIAPGSLIPNAIKTLDTLADHALSAAELDSTDFAISLNFLLAQSAISVSNNDLPTLSALLKQIDQVIAQKPQSFFWESYPMRLLEITLWALIATFLRLIVNTGYYLFRKRFIKSGVYHSFGLIVTIPILALLISIVLSFISISIVLGEAELNLDLTNIYISILVATFIGLSPWKGWDYLNGLADSLFKRLGSK